MLAEATPVHTYYLLDHEYTLDQEQLFGSTGHLLAFNPGPRDAELDVSLYFEGRDPERFQLCAPAGKSSESNYSNWPVRPNTRFALQVESSEPLVCQCTNGWNNTRNDYRPGAATRSPYGVRECAKSYLAIARLDNHWYVADGIVINNPPGIWVRESEWAILLNPGIASAQVTMNLHYDQIVPYVLEVPARRLKWVYMDEIAQCNRHYGVHFASDRPIAAQWLRTVMWNDRRELMAYWSVPCLPGRLGEG